MTDPTVMDMVLSELKMIRQSIHDLREDMNGKWGVLSSQVTAHEAKLAQQIAFTQENRIKLEEHERAIVEVRGAGRAVRWLGAGLVGAVGVVEFFLHGGHK